MKTNGKRRAKEKGSTWSENTQSGRRALGVENNIRNDRYPTRHAQSRHHDTLPAVHDGEWTRNHGGAARTRQKAIFTNHRQKSKSMRDNQIRSEYQKPARKRKKSQTTYGDGADDPLTPPPGVRNKNKTILGTIPLEGKKINSQGPERACPPFWGPEDRLGGFGRGSGSE